MKKIWLIGSGGMAQDYIRVLKVLSSSVVVIGRGTESAKKFENETGYNVITGGIEKFLSSNPALCSHAIVSVGVESLASTTTKLIEYGVKNILIEKPAGLNYDQVEQLAQKSVESSANVFVAYNRRFYASVQSAREIITNDGGVTSFNFEFTEWAHVIEKIPTSLDVKNKWFLANSTHVVDLAFYLGGKPEQICTFATGMIDWHPDASVFCGAGKSVTGALFSYQANWEAPGRWAVEVLTKKHRLIFKPLEKLQIIKINSLAIESMVIDDAFDTLYKPGLYAQTKNFLAGEHADMCLIDEQLNNMKHYYAMSNYKR